MEEATMGTIETLTERELAGLLQCSVAALRRMRQEKRGPRFCRVGRLIRYPRPWIQDWIEANEGSTSVPTGAPGCKIAPNAPEIGGPDAN